MMKHELLVDDGIVVVSPEGKLEAEDFRQLAATVDPFVEANGKLKGILIHTKSFPGWKDFTGLLTHLRFVKDHHRKIGKVAIVTDSKAAPVAASLAKHFVSVQIKHFEYAEKEPALAWLRQS